jgi:hypothetical protein
VHLQPWCKTTIQPYFALLVIVKNEDYESWQPALISDKDLYEAKNMAEKSY